MAIKLPIIIIGGGPAGLIAAETLSAAGENVVVYERKPSLGRKFLMAGRGGLNLTHSENLEKFLTRYGGAQEWLEPVIKKFTPDELKKWCEGLGQTVFTGSSGRVFPKSMKSSPLLRAWIARLESAGVKFVMQREWSGWDEQNNLTFKAPDGSTEKIQAKAVLLALGGASWPKLGSDGGWTDILKKHGVEIAPLLPANCGFIVNWSDIFRDKFSGQPLKNITLSFDGVTVPGEIMINKNGVEGGAVYALSASIRNSILKNAEAVVTIDLAPNVATETLIKKFQASRGRDSFSNWMRKVSGLSPVALGLLREVDRDIHTREASVLAATVKSLELKLTAPFPLERAISSAGGIKREAFNNDFMLKNLPGVFAAGEMLDWEAPTGGYLLQASFATGVCAAEGILKWLKRG